MIRAPATVFKVFSLLTMLTPIIGEAVTYAVGGTVSPSFASSLALFFINGAALVRYRWTSNYARVFRWSSWASICCFAWGAFYTGGLRAEQYDYVYFFILSQGFYFGARALAAAVGGVIAITLGLAVAEHLGFVAASNQTTATVALNLIISHIFIAWLAWQFSAARREAELRLRETLDDASRTRDQLRAMLDHSPALHFTKDLDGRFLQTNSAFERSTGFTRAQLIGHRISELFPVEMSEKFDRNDREVMSDGSVRTYHEQIGPKSRWMTTTLFPVRDDKRTITAIGGIILDTHDAITNGTENRAIKSALDETALVLTIDDAGRILSANANFCRLAGYAESDVIGRQTWPGTPGHRAEGNLFPTLARAAASTLNWTGEVRDYARDGREFNLVLVATPLHGPNGGRDHSIIICFDITAQTQGETRYRSLIETMDEGVVLWNQAGDCVQHNQAALRILRLTEGELTGRSPRRTERQIIREDGSLLPPENYPAAIALAKNEAVLNHVMGFIDFEDQTRWLRVNARPVLYLGELVAVCTFTDITQERETVRRLTANGDELQSLFQAMTEGVYLIGLDGRIKMVNRAASQILGYAEIELIGASSHTLFHHSRADGSAFPHGECHLYRSLRDGRIATEPDDCFWTKTGERIPVSTISVPVETNGGVTGALVTFRDLSELRRLEGQVKLEQAKSFQNAKLASLGEMSAGIAHEINNPLAIVTGGLEMLGRYRETTDKFEAKMVSILRATGRIAKIVKGLQKFSRSSTGSAHKDEALSEIVIDSIVMTETRAVRQGVSVRIPSLVEIQITCDVVEIEQVVINLINNAIDAAAQQVDGWVDVSTHLDGAHAVLRVIDSGPGIPADIEDKLFQPFFTTKPVGQGTGLGLSITKGILEQHGATIALNRTFLNTCFEVKFNSTGVIQRGT